MDNPDNEILDLAKEGLAEASSYLNNTIAIIELMIAEQGYEFDSALLENLKITSEKLTTDVEILATEA